jgi:hypothetical protein
MMIARPEEHRWIRVSNQDIGEIGCRHWHSRPRWGILGMMFNWWRIRLSSGCPLAGGRGRRAAPRIAGFPPELEPLVAQASPPARAGARAPGGPARA